MSKFIRFLSRRRTGRGINKSTTEDGGFKKKKGIVACKVILLDGTDMMVELPVRSTFVMREADFMLFGRELYGGEGNSSHCYLDRIEMV